jgi:hypothetical protein
MHRPFAPAPSHLGVETSSSNGHDQSDASNSHSLEDAGNASHFNNRSPPYQSSAGSKGPVIRPLDYSLLTTSEAVHSELSQTVADLAQWLEVIDQGLTNVLNPPIDEADDFVDQYANDSSALQSES